MRGLCKVQIFLERQKNWRVSSTYVDLTLTLLSNVRTTLPADLFGVIGHFTSKIFTSKMAPGEVGV